MLMRTRSPLLIAIIAAICLCGLVGCNGEATSTPGYTFSEEVTMQHNAAVYKTGQEAAAAGLANW